MDFLMGDTNILESTVANGQTESLYILYMILRQLKDCYLHV